MPLASLGLTLCVSRLHATRPRPGTPKAGSSMSATSLVYSIVWARPYQYRNADGPPIILHWTYILLGLTYAVDLLPPSSETLAIACIGQELSTELELGVWVIVIEYMDRAQGPTMDFFAQNRPVTLA